MDRVEELYINLVFEYELKESGQRIKERIIYINFENDCVQTIELDVKRCMKLHDYSVEQLQRKLQEGEIKIIPEPMDRTIEFEHIKKQQAKMLEIEFKKLQIFQGPIREKGHYENLYDKREEKFKKAIKLVEAILPPKEGPQYYIKRKKAKDIKNACKLYGISKYRAYRLLTKYLQAGRSTDALYVDYYIGNQIKNKEVTQKIGRPCEGVIKGSKGGINITEDIKQLFVYAICKWYENKNGHSLQATLDMLIREMFKDEEVARKTIETGVAPVPTYRQFKYWYDNEYKVTSRQIILRNGEKDFFNNSKGCNADILSEATVPMQVVYVDATIVDVYLRNKVTGKVIALRPTLYIGIDGATEMIVGFHVSLEPPGIAPLLSLLYSIIEDKQVLAKQLGIKLPKDVFPFTGLPITILGDRGEMVSPEFENVVKSLRSTLKNTSSYLGAAKGLVEQVFNTVNIEVNEWMPGKIEKHYRQKQQKDYRYNAKMDVKEFTEIIVKLIIHHNKKMLINRKRTTEMIAEDVSRTPIGIWNHLVKKCGAFTKLSTNELIMKLLRVGQASLTPQGIYFSVARAYYTCNHPKFLEWKVEARAKGRKSVQVKYDARNLNTIFLVLDNEAEIIPCELAATYQEYKIIKDCSEAEVTDYYDHENQQENKEYLNQMLNNNAFIDAREESIKRAEKEVGDEKPEIKNTQKEQCQARQENKEQNALVNKIFTEDATTIVLGEHEVVEEDEEEEIIGENKYDLIRQLQKEDIEQGRKNYEE